MAGNRVCQCSFSNILLHFKPPLSAAPPPFLNYQKYSSEERHGHDHDHVEDERAPSTAQEFVRVAEERQLRHHDEEEEEKSQPASQTVVKKVYNGPEVAVVGDSGDEKHDDEAKSNHL